MPKWDLPIKDDTAYDYWQKRPDFLDVLLQDTRKIDNKGF